MQLSLKVVVLYNIKQCDRQESLVGKYNDNRELLKFKLHFNFQERMERAVAAERAMASSSKSSRKKKKDKKEIKMSERDRGMAETVQKHNERARAESLMDIHSKNRKRKMVSLQSFKIFSFMFTTDHLGLREEREFRAYIKRISGVSRDFLLVRLYSKLVQS